MQVFFKQLVVCYLLLKSCTILYAQDSEFLSGKVIDEKTEEPVIFATVRIKGKAKGVITNMDGSFKIPSFFKKEGDTLLISSMGYVSTPIALSDVVYDKLNIIRLKPNIVTLNEVVVRANKKRGIRRNLSARTIVEMAIKNLSKNLSQNPYSYVGYYRDYQIKDGNYVNLNEAILKVVDQGFYAKDFETSKIKIFDYKKNTDFQRDTLGAKAYDYKSKKKVISNAFLKGYGGNEFVILRIHDPVRNRNVNTFDFVNVFEHDFVDNHSFQKEGEMVFNDDLFYKVSFKNLEPNSGFQVEGSLYVNKSSFAIKKFDYIINYPKRKTKKHKSSNETLLNIKLEYMEKDNLMYLNYHSMRNGFEVALPPEFYVEEALINFNKACFVLTFNNELGEKEVFRKSNYNLRYKGKRIKIRKLVVLGKEVLLYADGDKRASKLMFETLKPKYRDSEIDSELLKIVVKNVEDVNGNIVYEKKFSSRMQFREFFVQQLETKNTTVPTDSLVMKKDFPIFENQPIVKPDNFGDYWMNTPLQPIKN